MSDEEFLDGRGVTADGTTRDMVQAAGKRSAAAAAAGVGAGDVAAEPDVAAVSQPDVDAAVAKARRQTTR